LGSLTTHVLDTAHGLPAAGMAVSLYRRVGDRYDAIRSWETDADGRCDGPLLEGDALTPGRYRLVFAAAAYYRRIGIALPEPPFIDEVVLDFGIADVTQHYHVPLLVSPWSYATYRGS